METQTNASFNIIPPPAALDNARSNASTASEEPANKSGSETDRLMQPSKRATPVIIMVVLVVSVVVPLLLFMSGLYMSVVVIPVMWLVSVVVLKLLPFMPGLDITMS